MRNRECKVDLLLQSLWAGAMIFSYEIHHTTLAWAIKAHQVECLSSRRVVLI